VVSGSKQALMGDGEGGVEVEFEQDGVRHGSSERNVQVSVGCVTGLTDGRE